MTGPLEVTAETERLLLRPLETGDIDAIVEGISPAPVARMLARVPHPYARADAEAFVLACTGPDSTESTAAIVRDGKLIGAIGLRHDGELGYWLAEPYWGNGYMSEAVRAFLDRVFSLSPIETIRSGAFVENAASLRIQSKLGFRQVGRSAVYCLARAEMVTHVDTVLTRDRFRALQD